MAAGVYESLVKHTAKNKNPQGLGFLLFKSENCIVELGVRWQDSLRTFLGLDVAQWPLEEGGA